MNHDRFDLERELRAGRPQPRGDYAKALADEVRGPAPERTRTGRIGLALALSGLVIVAVASFGGIGYASSAKKQVAPWIVEKPNSAAAAQYCPPECPPPTTTTTNTPTTPTQESTPFTPPTTTEKPTTTVKTTEKGTSGSGGAEATTKGQNAAPKATSSQLPFTGLALWVPLAVGLMLISLGLVLRTRGRRRHTNAH